jgi:hypothetical protein
VAFVTGGREQRSAQLRRSGHLLAALDLFSGPCRPSPGWS